MARALRRLRGLDSDEIAGLGIELRDHHVDPASFRALADRLAGDDGAAAVADSPARVQDLVEELAALDLVDIQSSDVIVAMTGEESTYPSTIRRLTGAFCCPRPLPCGAAVAADTLPLPAGFADKVVLEASSQRAASPGGEFVAEVAHVLRPGGTAAAFLPAAACEPRALERELLEPAAAAGLDVTLHRLLDVRRIHPQARARLAIVLCKPDGWTPPAPPPPAAVPVVLPRAGRAAAVMPAAVVLCAVAVAVVTFADLQTPLRPAIALAFLLACPGLALVHMMRLSDWPAEIGIAVALSLAVNTLVVGGLLLAGVSSHDTVLAILLAVAVAALALDRAVRRRGAGAALELR